MRHSLIASALLLGTLATGARAMPFPEIPTSTNIHRVQMVCTPQSCVDQRTGVYTQSNCNRRGCWQSSGPVGRLPGYGGGRGYGGGGGYGGGYRGGPYLEPPPSYYGPQYGRPGHAPRW